MPFISIRTSDKLSAEQKREINSGLGEIISILPGKELSQLMTEIIDGQSMCFAGQERSGLAFVELRLYSESPMDAKREFVSAFYQLMEKTTGLAGEDIYMNIQEFNHWVRAGQIN